MESMYKLLQVRRSHRKFTEQAVEQEKIDAILRNALMSPAGKSLNPWEFIVVTDKEMQEKMSKCKPFGGAFLAEAPLSIVIIADTEKSDVWVEDCSVAAFNIQLTVEDLGLGTLLIERSVLHSLLRLNLQWTVKVFEPSDELIDSSRKFCNILEES